jgi:hypothetical protein
MLMLQPAWVSTPPAINGNADAPAWRTGAPLRIDSGRDGSQAWVLQDGEYLYVAVRAEQTEPVKAKTLADGVPFEGEDTVTLTFSNAARAVSFTVNAFGTHDAVSNKNPGFSPPWKSAGRILPSGYEVTMRIPCQAVSCASEGLHIALERHVAASGRTMKSAELAFHGAAGAFTATVTPHVVAGESGKFVERYRSLWPSQLAPSLPQNAEGVAVKQSSGNVTVAALDAQSGGRDDNAQSLAYTTPNDRVSTTLQRVQTSQDDVRDVVQSLSFKYDNRTDFSVSGGVATDRAVRSDSATAGSYAFTDVQYHSQKNAADLFWSNAGPQYDPQDEIGSSSGTNGFTAHVSHALGAVSVEGAADNYHDDIGTLVNADQRAKISLPITSRLSAAVSTSSDYSSAIGAYNENGLHLNYDARSAGGSVDYRVGSYENGFLQDAGVSAGFHIPLLGSLELQRRQRNFFSFDLPESTQLFDAVRLTHSFRQGSISVSYRNIAGDVPQFLYDATLGGSGLAVAIDRYLKIGLLHFSYDEPSGMFTAPSLSLKIVPGAKQQ